MNGDQNSANFIFVCGAVGSGNTFLFECLANNQNLYGINEDGLGGLLTRLQQSERNYGFCPHSLEAFANFAYALKGERETLLLKTPSNLSHMDKLVDTLPNSSFIVTMRDPHASILSGTRRHQRGIDFAAKEWEKDAKQALDSLGRVTIVSYEHLMQEPQTCLQAVNDHIMPLDNAVFSYASKAADPYRATGEWWRRNLSNAEIEDIESVVADRELVNLYEQVCGIRAVETPSADARPRSRWRRKLDTWRRRLMKALFLARKAWR